MNSVPLADGSAEKAHPPLGIRLALVAAAIIAEKLLLNRFADFALAINSSGIGAVVRWAHHWTVRFSIPFAAAVVLFALVRDTEPVRAAAQRIRSEPLKIRWLLLNGLLVCGLIPLTSTLYRSDLGPMPFGLAALAWAVLGAIAALSLFRAMASWAAWRELVRSLGPIWLYAAAAAFLATLAMDASFELWAPATGLTFWLVSHVLAPILPDLSINVATHELGTSRVIIEIKDACSGLEGLGLILAFLGAWLVYFRREFIFPRALLLIPIGLAAMFVLNVVRIALLMLIAVWWSPDVALIGFHSQAGWLAFNLVACGLALVSRRSRWLNREAAIAGGSAAAGADTHNPAATYLVPLLAIIAAGICSHALSGSFESLYALRLVAGAAALYWFRRELQVIKWAFSWRGLLVGVAVFAAWMIGAALLLPHVQMPAALARMSDVGRATWIGARVLGSVLTVPIAEELAYRGFLMRRLQQPDFESLPYERVHWLPLVISSVIFGAAHGPLWPVGILAGLAFGALVMRRRLLGEAVLAHAVANALVAAAVLGLGRWELW